MEVNNIKNEISKFLSEEHLKNLHEEAFYDVLNTLVNFVNDGSHSLKKKQEKLAWVCDSVMGSGKTTAIKVLLKYLANNFNDIPLLLVFAEKNLMLEVYQDVNTYAKEMGVRNLIEYVDSNNVNEVSHTLTSFQFVFITQQRFRDLTIGLGNWNEYRVFNKGHKPMQRTIERLIIVDEMPIFFDSAAFDVSSKDNSVDWFDKLAEGSSFTAEEIQLARTVIMMLMTYEMLKSKGNRTFTKALIKGVLDPLVEKEFIAIINRINMEQGDFESITKLRWFKKLLHTDEVGAIDRHSKGTSILCSKYIDYHKKGNIIILDGTAQLNNEIYKRYYKMINLPNHHQYKNRVSLFIRDINTTKESRDKKENDIHGKIASDLRKIREDFKKGIFPLANKMDVQKYIDNNAIDDKQRQFYEIKDKENGNLPINLLNTRGKNILSNYNALALLNLPIRNPRYYKLMGLGIYGAKLSLEQYEKDDSKENKTAWFKNENTQKIFEGALLSDILQIIHRSCLRNIKEQSEVHIYFYTHLKNWIIKLKEYLKLPDTSLYYDIADDKYNFLEKTQKFARKTRIFLEKNNDVLKTKSYTAGQIIRGEQFKKFININWHESFKRDKIIEVFLNEGVEIYVVNKKEKIHKHFRLHEDSNF